MPRNPAFRSGGARARLRRHFDANVGRILEGRELARVAGITEWSRRVRELRDEEGMQIATHVDRADLKPGQYLLVSSERAARDHSRVEPRIRAQVLEASGYTCEACGAGAGERRSDGTGRTVRLHVDHRDPRGGSTIDNLRVLCSVCNEGKADLFVAGARVNVMAFVRRASRDDQMQVYRWLEQKFGTRRPA